MKKLLFFILTLISGAGWTQNLTISARVVDIETQESLGYASVGIKGFPIGTISNNEGEFDFHFSPEHRNDILVISMLGYKNFEAPVWTLIDNAINVITLEKSPIQLQEIVISDTLTGGDILRIAFSRIQKNYPMRPFLLDGFYRDVKKVGGKHISLLEAAVKIYDENYDEPRNKSKLRERVRLIEVRKSLGYESKFTKYFDQDNLLEDLLLQNYIRYYDSDIEDEFLSHLGREKNSFFDGHDIYVVINKTNDEYLKLFIDKEDFAIVHLEHEKNYTDDNTVGKKRNLVGRFENVKKIINYKRYAGKMFLNFLSIDSKVNWYDTDTKEFKFETELFQQLMINKVDPYTKDRIGSTEKMRNYGLQYQDLPYNKEFWDNYNVIKETPLDQKVLADLEKFSPLEKQFQEY